MADSSTTSTSSNTETAFRTLNHFAAEGNFTTLPSVLEYTKHTQEDIRTAAVRIASSFIKENLINHYHQLEHEVRQKLVLLLESVDSRIIDDISKDLYSDSHDRRLRSIQILGLLKKNPRITSILAHLLKDRDVRIRATAVHLLGKLIGPNDFDLIIALLNDPDQRVRANTIEALEQVHNKRFLPIFIRYKKDPNNRIRGNILKALYNMGFKEIEDDLLSMLKNADVFMNASALWVISQIKYSTLAITNTAARLILSENEMVTRNAKNALVAINSPRAKGFLRYLC